MTLPWTVENVPETISQLHPRAEGEGFSPAIKNEKRHNKKQKKLTVLIEDDTFLQKRWKKNFPENFLTFSEPKEFLSAVEQKHLDINDIEVLVVDYFFSLSHESKEKDLCLKDFFKDIRKLYPDTIFVYSDAPQDSLKLPKNDPKILFLEKRLYTLDELRRLTNLNA